MSVLTQKETALSRDWTGKVPEVPFSELFYGSTGSTKAARNVTASTTALTDLICFSCFKLLSNVNIDFHVQ